MKVNLISNFFYSGSRDTETNKKDCGPWGPRTERTAGTVVKVCTEMIKYSNIK